MKDTTKNIGGFAAVNTGTIQDCYSAVHVKAKQSVSGFCAESSGFIRNCMFRGELRNGKREKSGLVAKQSGTLSGSFWLRGNREAENEYTDWVLGAEKGDFSESGTSDLNAEWDVRNIWSYRDGLFSLYDRAVKPVTGETVVEIGSEDDLLRMAEDVRDGKAKQGVVYRLIRDVDMGGVDWTPIGADPHRAFRSIFDGNGYAVKNFFVKTDKHPYAGFFGCVGKGGAVLNLRVDCVLTGKGNCSGPMCGLNMGSIQNCVANARCSLSRYTGGFVGQNEGVIKNSCALGKTLAAFLILWWLPLLGLLLVSFAICIVFYLNAQTAPQEMFAPIIIDPNAHPVEDTIPKPEDGDKEATSATFIVNAEMEVSTQNYVGRAGLKCPSWSKLGFVATVRVSREDLLSKGVSISDEYYTVYKSGLIKPGFGVDVISLNNLPDGSGLPAGEYSFSVLFEFYNTETNEKHPVDSVAPISVVVR